MKYYKILVTLCNDELITYRNITDEQLREFIKIVWVQGVKKQINHTTTELISPFLLKKVLVVEQASFETA